MVECPNRKMVLLVEQDRDDFNEDPNQNFDQAPRFDEEITYGDMRESLAISKKFKSSLCGRKQLASQ